ncbi:MAG: hypothetical protein ACLUIW_10750 [Dysosmobacter welbionis]
MTRNEEYQALLQELETTPAALDGAVERALRRRKRDRRLRLFGVPAGSLAACFAAFVLLVNLFPPFARACGSVPVLRSWPRRWPGRPASPPRWRTTTSSPSASPRR